jgi:hypothetical protein
MGKSENPVRKLHATLCEIEHGLFFVTYETGMMKRDPRLPPYQVGTSDRDARQRIEQSARMCGYEDISWDLGPGDVNPAHARADPAAKGVPATGASAPAIS